MSSKVCRLCRAVVATKRAVQLFSHAGLAKQWPSRITALLGILVEKDDGISPLICDVCRNRILSLEKAAADLAAFKEMARCSSSVLGPPAVLLSELRPRVEMLVCDQTPSRRDPVASSQEQDSTLTVSIMMHKSGSIYMYLDHFTF